MTGIVAFPSLVQDALAQYGDLFASECQRRHFAEYLTGLIVAERKTVLGIHDEFARTTEQSCLNRFLIEAPGMSRASTGGGWNSSRRTRPPATVTKASFPSTTP